MSALADDRLEPDTIVLSVCVSCRPVGGPDEARPGAELLEALRSSVMPGVTVRPVQCLSVCKRPCTVALTAPGRYTYLFGDVDPSAGVADLAACVESYRTLERGYMLWRERPESLRRGILARIPPLDWLPGDGAHPR